MSLFQGPRSPQFLAVYSGLLTVTFVTTTLCGFSARRPTTFDTLTVQRLNVVEPDGTLRLVISNKALFPGLILHRRERPHPHRKTAGVLFFNDEGTENGGLLFGGEKGTDGQATSYGHLSFDAYDQDQVFTIDAPQDGSQRQSGLAVNDSPNYSTSELLDEMDRVKSWPTPEQQAEMRKFFASHDRAHSRLYLGRRADRSVGLSLKDVQGHDRLVLQVGADGSSFLRFLDQNGKVLNEWPPQSKPE
jgi:hypothetical protein